ncbi:TPA: hypothetical protein ACGUMG_004371 [Vibrio vulnificus]
MKSIGTALSLILGAFFTYTGLTSKPTNDLTESLAVVSTISGLLFLIIGIVNVLKKESDDDNNPWKDYQGD